MTDGALYRLASFADGPSGGNPAGVWLGDTLPDVATMQRIAAEVGFSETAFVCPGEGETRKIRYYSPVAEVAFCGHATIAAGVILGRTAGQGTYRLQTAVGEVPVTASLQNGEARASLVSVTPQQAPARRALVDGALALLGWSPQDLDPAIPPVRAFAGAWHLVLAVREAECLARLDYDFEKLKALMIAHDLTTLQLVRRAGPDLFHARNPFPVGGIVEDPATGAAAAAFGGYLRDAGLIDVPARFVIRQGQTMGQPSVITVDVAITGGITVSGSAITI